MYSFTMRVSPISISHISPNKELKKSNKDTILTKAMMYLAWVSNKIDLSSAQKMWSWPSVVVAGDNTYVARSLQKYWGMRVGYSKIYLVSCTTYKSHFATVGRFLWVPSHPHPKLKKKKSSTIVTIYWIKMKWKRKRWNYCKT